MELTDDQLEVLRLADHYGTVSVKTAQSRGGIPLTRALLALGGCRGRAWLEEAGTRRDRAKVYRLTVEGAAAMRNEEAVRTIHSRG